MTEITIHPIAEKDHERVARLAIERWGTTLMISRGKRHRIEQLPGFIAYQAERPVGLITYQVEAVNCEIVTLDGFLEGKGVGSALIQAVRQVAEQAGCTRLWLITTNDNLHALGFYQKRGFVLVAVHANALAHSRKLNQMIPLIGMHGIPLRDELELEIRLNAGHQ